REYATRNHAVAKCFALHVRHHVVKQPRFRTRIQQRYDVRVGKARCNSHYALEAIQPGECGERRLQNLQYDATVMLLLVRKEHRGHATAAQLAFQYVAVGDGGRERGAHRVLEVQAAREGRNRVQEIQRRVTIEYAGRTLVRSEHGVDLGAKLPVAAAFALEPFLALSGRESKCAVEERVQLRPPVAAWRGPGSSFRKLKCVPLFDPQRRLPDAPVYQVPENDTCRFPAPCFRPPALVTRPRMSPCEAMPWLSPSPSAPFAR